MSGSVALLRQARIAVVLVLLLGVLDMLRFQQFTAGQFWRDEYGFIEKPEDFKALYAYSPYHNVKDGTNYPNVLFLTVVATKMPFVGRG